MSRARIRFAVAAVAFAAWLGWLLNLAISTAHPVVLSEPQFLVSNLDVIAKVPEIKEGVNKVQVVEVHWPDAERARLVNQEIAVTNLSECKDNWQGPGEYILALLPAGMDQYRVAPLPRSPGFAGPMSKAGRPRIYPATPRTRQQLDNFQKPKAVN
jgi:hypothetical protein